MKLLKTTTSNEKWSDKPKTENSWKNSLKKKLEQHQKKKKS